MERWRSIVAGWRNSALGVLPLTSCPFHANRATKAVRYVEQLTTAAAADRLVYHSVIVESNVSIRSKTDEPRPPPKLPLDGSETRVTNGEVAPPPVERVTVANHFAGWSAAHSQSLEI